jgi:hypothetical protein
MDITLILADSAEVDPGIGKAHALGMGWNQTSTPTPPMALVFMLDVDWGQTNLPFNIDITLEDDDGQNVLVQTPSGMAPLAIHAEGEVGRPPGTPAGTKIRMPLTITISSGITLVPGHSYSWKAKVTRKLPDTNGESLAQVKQSFFVRTRPDNY